MTSAFRILGEGQLALTKFLFVTDGRVDLRDFPALLTHILERTHPETDLFVFANLAMDTLDYTGPEVNRGSKGVWLGLGPAVRELPRAFRPSTPPPGKYSRQRRVTVAAVASSAKSSSGYQGFRRASMRIGGVRTRWLRLTRSSAAWRSAAGSKRVKVVHRKFIGEAAARRGSSVSTKSGQPANAGCAASRAAAGASAA